MGDNRKKRGSSGTQHPVPQQGTNLQGRGEQSRPSSVTLGVTTEIRQSKFELRQGPIPDAEELIRYKEAHPDAPEIILSEFKTQGAHRRGMERRALALDRKDLDAAIRSERFGTASALLVTLFGFGCGTFLVATGHEVAGTVIFGIDVTAVVTAFILGRPKAPPQQ